MILSTCAASFRRECRHRTKTCWEVKRYKVMKNIFFTVFFLVLMGVMSIAMYGAEGVNYLSPQALVLSEDEKFLYVAEGGAKQIAVFSTDSNKVIKTIALSDEPTGLALSSDGKCLYVTCAGSQGQVCVVGTDTAQIIKRIPVGHSPCSPVLSPDGKVLYVCNRFSNDVSVISITDNKHIAGIKVLREPFAAEITPDGKWLYVGNCLPDGPANAESVASKVSVINTETKIIDASISLPNGSMGLHGVAVSPDGRYVYVSHILD